MEIKDYKEQAVQLISRYVVEKLGRVNPLWYERLYTLPSEAKNDRELKILMLAVHYAMWRDIRSVSYVEQLFFNWQECGVPRWVLKRLASADPPVGKELLEELGYGGETDEPFDIRSDEYYRFYRGSTLGD
ncbi:MAG: hypothetical protein GX489_01260 [Firmicutes bacterium]|nr:hypothetical protein [Bacillota bacterium]